MFKKTISTALLTISLSTISIVNAASIDNSQFKLAMQSSERPDVDKARDKQRKPEKVMKFFGIEPGMKVLEVLSSGGYYTEVLSHKVGPTGTVYAQNNKFILEVLDGRFAKEFSERTADNRLKNVTHYQVELNDIDLKNKVDVVTIVLNYHDFYSLLPKTKRLSILKRLKSSLKPGGVLGLIDMESGTKTHNKDLHRIHHQIVRDEFGEAGFTLDSEAYFLRNKNDDYTKMVFDPAVRGKTDRFVFKFKT